MKAVLFRQHGGPEVLEYTDFPTPEPKPGQALIRLRAAALNRMDMFVRNGWPGLKLEMPHINDADGAGEVVALDSAHSELETRLGAQAVIWKRGEGLKEGVLWERGGIEIGDHVVINANLGCGRCEFCLD